MQVSGLCMLLLLLLPLLRAACAESTAAFSPSVPMVEAVAVFDVAAAAGSTATAIALHQERQHNVQG